MLWLGGGFLIALPECEAVALRDMARRQLGSVLWYDWGASPMRRSFLFGLGWILIVTALLGLFAGLNPDNPVNTTVNLFSFFYRALLAIGVFIFASKSAPAKSRWPAIGCWFLGFLLGYPLGNLMVNGTVLAFATLG